MSGDCCSQIDLLNRIHNFIVAAESNDLTEDHWISFERLLRESDEACRLYAKYMDMSALLPSVLEPAGVSSSSGVFSPRPQGPARAFPLSLSAGLWHNAIGYVSEGWPLAYSIATVVTVLGLWICSHIYMSPPEQIARSSVPAAVVVEPKVEYVGRITGMVDCQWAEKVAGGGWRVAGAENPPSTIHHPPSLVSLGDEFVLASGLMEITYDTGAKVILQGPVTYEVEANGGYLAVGKLTGKLEKGNDEARMTKDEGLQNSSFVIRPSSFVIHTPTATVTDLGTEFGIEVSKEGHTTSHVFRGAVELRLIGGENSAPRVLRLTENESAKVEFGPDRAARVKRESVGAIAFAREMPKRVPIKLFNTGKGLKVGELDPHWQITAADYDPDFQERPATVVTADSVWLPNESSDGSQWISVPGNGIGLPDDAILTFRTTFGLTGALPRTAVLQGCFAADNLVTAIRLNGQKMRVPAHGIDSYYYFTPFVIARGFVDGTNVLEIDVKNIGSRNPMGLRVELEGSVQVMK